jgi:hypothetical protein
VGLPWPRKPAEPWLPVQASVLALLALPPDVGRQLAGRMKSTASGLGLPGRSLPTNARVLLAATRAGTAVWTDPRGRWRGLLDVARDIIPAALGAIELGLATGLNEGERARVKLAADACS